MNFSKKNFPTQCVATFLFLLVLPLVPQNKLIHTGPDDFTLWMVKDNQPILATVTYQTAELNFYSPSEQGYIGKVNATYYSEPELKNEILKRKESNIYFPYGQGSFSNDYKGDSFGAIWTGVIRPSYTETYKFITRTDDGVKLWINGKLLIDKWYDMGTSEFSAELALMSGKEYSIKMEYYDKGGDAYAELSWQSNSTMRSVIKEVGNIDLGYSYENPYGLESDWTSAYFKGKDFKDQIFTRKESSLSFTSDKDPFAPGIPNENFCAKFTSSLKVPKSGVYTFYTTSDDGIRFKINGNAIIDQWKWMGATEFSEKLDLKEGEEISIEVDYFQGGGGKFLKVEWQAPNKAREILIQKGKKNRNHSNIVLDIYPGKIYSKDLNRDGKNDLIILHPTYNGKISILHQEKDHILNPPLVLKAGKDPKEILFSDLNLDGREDLIVVSKTSPNFLLFWNFKNEWKQEISPKWNNTIKELKILFHQSKSKVNNSPIFILIGKSGEMSKTQYSPSSGWSKFEAVSTIEKQVIETSKLDTSLENKCLPIEGKRKICYDKFINIFSIND